MKQTPKSSDRLGLITIKRPKEPKKFTSPDSWKIKKKYHEILHMVDMADNKKSWKSLTLQVPNP